jgi:CDGSH-type Zn-finger protein
VPTSHPSKSGTTVAAAARRPAVEGMKVVVTKDGPYVVSGGVPLSLQVMRPNAEGLSWDWKESRTFKAGAEYSLCRCGHSKNKPFCDGSHARVHFDGAETATRQPFSRQAEAIDGPTLAMEDAEVLCAFARFCDPGGKIWNLIGKSDDPAARKLAIREGMSCPSGRLVVHDKGTGKILEPKLPPRSESWRTRR